MTPVIPNKSLPLINEISTHQSQESISLKGTSKVVSSNRDDHRRGEIKNYSSNKNSFLSNKIQEQVKLIEQEYRTAIKNAKEEWNFNNTQTEELLCNKIRKKYKKMIDKLVQGIN